MKWLICWRTVTDEEEFHRKADVGKLEKVLPLPHWRFTNWVSPSSICVCKKISPPHGLTYEFFWTFNSVLFLALAHLAVQSLSSAQRSLAYLPRNIGGLSIGSSTKRITSAYLVEQIDHADTDLAFFILNSYLNVWEHSSKFEYKNLQ